MSDRTYAQSLQDDEDHYLALCGLTPMTLPLPLVHPLLQTIRGMCTDEEPYPVIARALSETVDVAKDLEGEVERLRSAIEEYRLWRPGEKGHAEAHRKLMEVLR